MNETIDYLENQWGKLMSTPVGQAINTLPRQCIRDLWHFWKKVCQAEGEGFPRPEDESELDQTGESTLGEEPGPELPAETDDEIQEQSIELLNRARSGDQEALVDLWNLHERTLRSFLGAMNERWKSKWVDKSVYPITDTWLDDAVADFRGEKFFGKNRQGRSWQSGYNPQTGKYAAWLWVCVKNYVTDKSKRDFPEVVESLEKIFEEKGWEPADVRIRGGSTVYDCDMQEMRRLCNLLIKQTRACVNERVWWVLFLDFLLPKLTNFRRRSAKETALWMGEKFKEKIPEAGSLTGRTGGERFL